MYILKLIKWIYWTISYKLEPPKDLEDTIKFLQRTKFNAPWYKFKPSIYFREPEWVVHLKDQSYYVHHGFTLNDVEVFFDLDTLEVVGFEIHQHEFEKIQIEHKEYIDKLNEKRQKLATDEESKISKENQKDN